jgi:hypothetical protein
MRLSNEMCTVICIEFLFLEPRVEARVTDCELKAAGLEELAFPTAFRNVTSLAELSVFEG